MNGRLFDGQQVEAFIADGTEKFKKSSEKAAVEDDDEDDGEESKRLDEFGEWIEREEKEAGGDEEVR